MLSTFSTVVTKDVVATYVGVTLVPFRETVRFPGRESVFPGTGDCDVILRRPHVVPAVRVVDKSGRVAWQFPFRYKLEPESRRSEDGDPACQ